MNKSIKVLAVLLLIAFMFSGVGANAVAAESTGGTAFVYIHDPSENPEAMKDIVKDESAVYGFKPSETGSLKQYASADWSDPAVVEAGKQERIAYHNSIKAMYDILYQMQGEGKSVEEIARAVSSKRNEIRLLSYENDPDGLATLKQRNLEKYGHEEGPLPDELFTQYGSWEKVIEKAFSANVGMDACLGLYDDYYNLYVALGQVKSDITVNTDNNVPSPETGDNSQIEICIVFILLAACVSTLKRKKHQ